MFSSSRSFKEAESVNRLRRNTTRDLVERVWAISPEVVKIINHPIKHVPAIFNPGMEILDRRLLIFPRIILGYYLYISAIGRIELSLDQVLGGEAPREIEIELIIQPNNQFDIYGCEDPRAQRVEDKLIITYAGRSREYYPELYRIDHGQQVNPILAIDEGGVFRKRICFRLHDRFVRGFIRDRDAMLLSNDERLFLLHRPELIDEPLSLRYSILPELDELLKHEGFNLFILEDPRTLLKPARFEYRVGWAAPPIKLRDGWLTLIHSEGIDCIYRVFAALLSADEEVRIEAITPSYIMEPKTSYEIFGDRPCVVFPCGAIAVGDDLIISYGAADQVLGIGRIPLNELMAELKEVKY